MPLDAEGSHMPRGWKRPALILGAAALLFAALAATAAAGTRSHSAGSVSVAFIYPKTGGLSAFGQEEFDGFQAGLDYVKGKCGGYTINPTYVDDATDPATAIAAFKSAVGQGTKIIAGTGSSGIALQLGPLAAQDGVLYISGAAAAFIAWANTTTSAAMWQSLQQQGVAQKLTLITGLANRASYDPLGPLVPGVTLISHYVYQAPHNAVNTYLVKWMAKNRHT